MSVRCLLRGVRLVSCAAPRTPLRILAIVAIDTLHVLRTSQPLRRDRINELAMLVDFQACTNAVWDDKHVCETGYDALRQRLENAGQGWRLEDYLSRLRELETRRPSVGGDHRRFEDVRSYREAVARLSLATLVALAFDTGDVDAEIRATHDDSDLETLFRIVMQCQIIDDVVDYAVDRSAGLPSFLTACASLPQAMELTAAAARRYGASRESARDGAFPLRVALRGCTLMTSLVVRSCAGLRTEWRERWQRIAASNGPR